MSNAPIAQRASAAGQGRNHASLRDHLNERVAPYLKRALIEGLNHDVEFPLQWLGEHLIHMSMLYEGNPDSTSIKERFKYNHDAPPPPVQAQPQDATIKTEEEGAAGSSQMQPQIPQQDSTMSNGVSEREAVQSTYVDGATGFASQHDSTSLAVGLEETAGSVITSESRPQSAPATEDTEMGGAE